MSFPQNMDLRNLERMILFLEKTDLSKATQASVEARTIAIDELLSIHQVPPDDILYKKLEGFSEHVFQYYSIHEGLKKQDVSRNQEELKKQRESKKNEVCYVGVSGKVKVRVIASDKSLDFVRVYHDREAELSIRTNKFECPRITIVWSFNPKGRIEEVNYSLFPEETKGTILRSTKEMPPCREWEIGLFEYNEFPERMQTVASDIHERGFFKKYLSILRFGHHAVNILAENLLFDYIRDSYVLMDKQVQLREIKRNPLAIEAISSAARLLPEIHGQTNNLLNVVYKN